MSTKTYVAHKEIKTKEEFLNALFNNPSKFIQKSSGRYSRGGRTIIQQLPKESQKELLNLDYYNKEILNAEKVQAFLKSKNKYITAVAEVYVSPTKVNQTVTTTAETSNISSPSKTGAETQQEERKQEEPQLQPRNTAAEERASLISRTTTFDNLKELLRRYPDLMKLNSFGRYVSTEEMVAITRKFDQSERAKLEKDWDELGKIVEKETGQIAAKEKREKEKWESRLIPPKQASTEGESLLSAEQIPEGIDFPSIGMQSGAVTAPAVTENIEGTKDLGKTSEGERKADNDHPVNPVVPPAGGAIPVVQPGAVEAAGGLPQDNNNEDEEGDGANQAQRVVEFNNDNGQGEFGAEGNDNGGGDNGGGDNGGGDNGGNGPNPPPPGPNPNVPPVVERNSGQIYEEPPGRTRDLAMEERLGYIYKYHPKMFVVNGLEAPQKQQFLQLPKEEQLYLSVEANCIRLAVMEGMILLNEKVLDVLKDEAIKGSKKRKVDLANEQLAVKSELKELGGRDGPGEVYVAARQPGTMPITQPNGKRVKYPSARDKLL